MKPRKTDEPGSGPRFLVVIENTLLALTLAVMLGLAVTQIVLRNVFDTGLIWADGLLQVLVLWVGLLGAVAASRDDRQITVDVLTRFVSARIRPWLRVVTDLFTGGLSVLLAYHAGRLVAMEKSGGMKAFGEVPLWISELILPIAFGLIALRYLIFAVQHFLKALRGDR